MRRLIKIGLPLIIAAVSILILTSGVDEVEDDTRIVGAWVMWAPTDSMNIEVEWTIYSSRQFQWRAYALVDTSRMFRGLAQGHWTFREDMLTLNYENGGVEKAGTVFAIINDRNVVQLHYTTGEVQTLYERPR